jgi:hypothetical protein
MHVRSCVLLAGAVMLLAAHVALAVEVEMFEGMVEEVGSDATPTELENAASDFHQSEKEGGAAFPQFPGPRYGLPGYKESHNWEGGNDVDLLSPLIFDWHAYKTIYKMDSAATEAAVKKDWMEKLAETKYPDCPQGREHDRPPDGFSLKTYFDANNVGLKAKLGETPVCLEIAKEFLSTGLFEGAPLAPALPCKTCPNADGTPPPSSWVLCTWRSWRRMPGYRRRYQMKTYNREIYEWDRMRSRDDTTMNGFEMVGSYSVSFWYRPQKSFVGEVFNFGEANKWYSRYYKSTAGNSAFWAPGVSQYGFEDGVRLKFQVSTSSNINWICEPTSNETSTASSPGGVLPFNKWTYVALTVNSDGGKVTARVYYDNQASQVSTNTGGSHTGLVAEVAECEVSATTITPKPHRRGGYRVWSYYPGRRRRRRLANRGGSLAGLTYWDQALSQERVNSMYKYEGNGVDAWTVENAEGKNNGAC